MAGIVFAKFTKPTMRAETILFSKNALITVRNGSMYLVCRIADLRWGRSTRLSSTALCAQRSSCIQQQYAKQHYWALSGLGETLQLCSNQNNPIWSTVAADRHAVLLIVCPLLWAHLFFAGMIKFFENPSDISPASRRGNILEAATNNHSLFIALSLHST